MENDGSRPSDAELLAQVREKTDKIAAALSRVIPELDSDTVGAIAADLGDFWEIGERHRVRVQQIIGLAGVQNRTELATLLRELHYRDLMAHLWFHYKSMRQKLPDVIDFLEAGNKKTK